MSVFVMNRQEAIRYCHKKNSKESAIISISDPYNFYTSQVFRSKENKVVDILRLYFCDADRVGVDVYGRKVTEDSLMNDYDAQKVCDFVKANDNVDIIVHCDAGISRSAGVAAAIMKYLTGSDMEIFKNGKYQPNMWCYRKVLSKFYEI